MVTSNQANIFESFEKQRSVFEGMQQHYDAKVVPVLKELDEERARTYSSAIGTQVLIGMLGFFIIFIAITAFGVFGLFGAIPVVVISILIWRWQTKAFVVGAKKTLIGGMVSFFGWTYSPISEEPKIFKRLCQLKLFTNFDSKTFSDRMGGTAFDRNFSLTEIFLTRTETRTTTDHNGHTQTESHTVTVFNGCLVSIDVTQEFLGETIVLRRGFLFNPSKVKGLKKVGLVSSKFEKDLRAYGSDQVESRYLLTPTLIEQIIAYEKAFKGKNLRFGYIDGQIHIALETGNRFEFKRLYESVLTQGRIATLLREISATFDLIEGLIVKSPDRWKEEFGHHALHTKDELNS